jgi:hypothetical protein
MSGSWGLDLRFERCKALTATSKVALSLGTEDRNHASGYGAQPV